MLKRIVGILKDYTEVPSVKIIPESRLTEDLGFNSLDLMNIVIAFEGEFGIEIPEIDVQELFTVGDIANYFRDKNVK